MSVEKDTVPRLEGTVGVVPPRLALGDLGDRVSAPPFSMEFKELLITEALALALS